MLSLQYLNKRLKKSHIEQILKNYNIKYTTMKNEIENKISIMIKTFTEDISQFLNNLDEVAEQKQQLKNLENKNIELQSLREEIKDKIHEQTKLRREIELLRIENNRLRSNMMSTFNNSRKKLKYTPLSPTHRNISYKSINTVSNFRNGNYNHNHKSPINSPIKMWKDTNSLYLKTEKKDKKEYKDTKIFKSPQIEVKKAKTKNSDFNLNDNKNKNKNKNCLRKNINKNQNNKNILSSSTKETAELNKKNINSNSSKNIRKQTKIITNKSTFIKNKNMKNLIIGKNLEKLETTNKDKLLNKNINTKVNNIEKESSKTLFKFESLGESKKKESEDYSSDKESESKSKITNEYYDSEEADLTLIDEEINEMNYIEKEILSVMGQINEFKQKNNNLT